MSSSAHQQTRIPRAFGSAFGLAGQLAVHNWNTSLRDVRKTQLEQLRRLIDHAKHTEFGRRYDFAHIRSDVDFRQAVPIGDYDTFSPWIDRMRAGEQGLLVPEFVQYFGNSSGSSNQGKPKFLPITERQLSLQRKTAADTLFRFLHHHGVGDFLSGYSLGLFPPITMRQEGPVKITSNPALMVATLPRLSKLVYLPEDEILSMSDYDQKLQAIAERYLHHDVRLISGTTCWFSLLFDKLLEAARKQGSSARTVTDIWPNLTVLMGGGVSAEPYRDVLRDRLGADVPLIDTYNATEGGIYASTDPASQVPGMLMIPHRGTYFEFVPVEELHKSRPTRLPLWEVEKDRVYAIIVTTVSGLYAYTLGDLVRFPSIEPLHIEFAGRISGCLSTTQELTTHVEIQEAVAQALKEKGGKALDFTAGADVGVDGTAKSRYVLFVEFSESIPEDQQGFIEVFDRKLGELNRVYREHRQDNTAIFPPELVVLPPGSVARFMKENGNSNVQSKFPRIVDDARRNLLRTYGGHSTLASK